MDEDASEDKAKSTDTKKVSSAKNAVDKMDVEVGMDEKTWSEVSFYENFITIQYVNSPLSEIGLLLTYV